MRISRRFYLWAVLAACLGAQPLAAEDPHDFFERRVRPLLAANCLVCHGAKKQEAGLRLDSRSAILRGGDSGPAAIAGQPGQSRLMEAIRWTSDLQMPPEKQLMGDAIKVMEQWVQMGMPWPDDAPTVDPDRSHWAFQPVRHPSLPPVARISGSITAVDRFLLAELEKQGLQMAPEADRHTLLRRASFDLRGLPPLPEEIREFVTDPAPDAYERLIDRLLASPQYGERWGRHWLDVARYADTKGYVFFEEKSYPWAYTYRDYVIQAWNEDRPYDRFVLEQLAADQLELSDNAPQLAALGFLTVGGHFMNSTHDIIDDRIDVVTRGLLGLTVTCGRCHDHKYDPILMSDYYGLYGVFRSCYEPTVPPVWGRPPDTDEYRKFAEEMAAREKKLVDFVRGKHAELVEGARSQAGKYLQSAYQLRDQPPTDDFMLLVDKGDLNPTMILRWQLYLSSTAGKPDPVWSLWHALAALPEDSFAAEAGKLLAALASLPPSLTTVNPRVVEALSKQPVHSMQEVAAAYGELLQSVDVRWKELLAAAGTSPSPPRSFPETADEQLRQVLYGTDSPPDVPLAMDWGFLSLFPDRPTQEEYKKLLKEVEQWMMTGPGAPARAMVLLDDTRPYSPRIFLRGNPHRLGDSVTRRFISVLNPSGAPFTRGSGREELARAIVSPENPLTARVLVNRVWLHHFGQGLVGTPSDFGLRSDPPSHPELLDWLAAEFVSHGWSLKWLQRTILLSAAYRQQSIPASTEQAARASTVDPENRLLSHAPRRRLEFEVFRDALLSVADSLDLSMGGKPVEMFGDKVVSRRTVYGALDRMDVPPLLTTFDFPDPLTTNPQRSLTTIAPQALFVMNSPLVAELAGRLASRRDLKEVLDVGQRVERMFELCLGRPPTTAERSDMLDFVGDEPTDDDWQRMAHGLLLTNEFFYVD